MNREDIVIRGNLRKTLEGPRSVVIEDDGTVNELKRNLLSTQHVLAQTMALVDMLYAALTNDKSSTTIRLSEEQLELLAAWRKNRKIVTKYVEEN